MLLEDISLSIIVCHQLFTVGFDTNNNEGVIKHWAAAKDLV